MIEYSRINLLVYGIQGKIRNHDKDIVLSTLWRSLWQQHVLWPSASAKLESSQFSSSARLVLAADASEGSIVRNSNRRLVRSTTNLVFARNHWKN